MQVQWTAHRGKREDPSNVVNSHLSTVWRGSSETRVRNMVACGVNPYTYVEVAVGKRTMECCSRMWCDGSIIMYDVRYKAMRRATDPARDAHG